MQRDTGNLQSRQKSDCNLSGVKKVHKCLPKAALNEHPNTEDRLPGPNSALTCWLPFSGFPFPICDIRGVGLDGSLLRWRHIGDVCPFPCSSRAVLTHTLPPPPSWNTAPPGVCVQARKVVGLSLSCTQLPPLLDCRKAPCPEKTSFHTKKVLPNHTLWVVYHRSIFKSTNL